MDSKFWLEVVKELGSLGLLGVLIYYFIKMHVPKLTDTFENSLDKITQRHFESMKEISTSMDKMSDAVSAMREIAAVCKFKQGEGGNPE